MPAVLDRKLSRKELGTFLCSTYAMCKGKTLPTKESYQGRQVFRCETCDCPSPCPSDEYLDEWEEDFLAEHAFGGVVITPLFTN